MKSIKRALAGFGADVQTRRALSASIAALAMKMAAAGSIFLVTLILARRLGAEGSGVFGLASTVMSIVVVIGSLGLDLSAVRSVAAYNERDEWAKLRAWTTSAIILTFIVGTTAALITAAVGGRLAAALGGGADLAYAIAVMALASVPLVLSRLFGAFLRGIGNFILSHIVDPLLLPTTAAVILVVLPITSVRDAALAYAAASFLAGIISYVAWSRAIKGRGVPHDALKYAEIVTRALPIYGTLFGSFATPWVVMLAVGFFGTEADAGIYRVAAQFLLLVSFVLQAVESGMAPQFAALHAKGDLYKVAQAARRVTLLLVLTGGLPSALIIVYAPQVLSFFGPEFVSGAAALRILVGGQIVVSLLGPVGSIMLMIGLERYSLINSTAGAILVTILSVILIPRYGIEGAAIAVAITLIARAVGATLIVWIIRGFFFPLGLVRR